jgi:polyferredoxin
MTVVGVVLAVVFAGVGIILLGGLGIGAVVLALAISPLLLPLLLPLAVIWYLCKRSSKNRMVREQAV